MGGKIEEGNDKKGDNRIIEFCFHKNADYGIFILITPFIKLMTTRFLKRIKQRIRPAEAPAPANRGSFRNDKRRALQQTLAQE